MPISLQRVDELLQKHGEETASILVVGNLAETSPSSDVFSFSRFARDDQSALRRQLGVCIDPEQNDVHVLAKLRDIHCTRVLVFQTTDSMSSSEFLALGFQKLGEESDCTLYLHAAEVTDRPREWNNAKNWAHPENFDKT